jgi:RNA polymerase sigma-70 factor (ECF subfamily)
MIRRNSPRNAASHAEPARDPDILRKIAGGELDALGDLYDRYHELIRAFVARATSNAEDVDDLVHATFLAAARSAARYDGRPSCRPWLVGIAAQLLRRRRQSFGRMLAVLSSLRGLRATSVDPRAALQARTDVERALECLSEVKRVTLLLVEIEGLSCAEVAAALDVPIGTIWTRLHAARRELRRVLEDGA